MTDYADLSVDPEVVLLRGLVEADSAFCPPPEAPTAVDPEAFKAAMRVLAGGVVMVTARKGERLWGLTISACCSISASPPQVLISLAHSASCLPPILETGRFGLSILRADQKSLAELGAAPGAPKYVEAFCQEEPGAETTRIAGALAHLDCRVTTTFDVADHALIIGTVERAASEADLEQPGPLVYFNRAFHALGGPLP